MKDGQCSRRKGPAPGGSGPSSWPVSRLAGAVLVRTAGPAARAFGGTRSLNAPFLDPRGHQCACTGKRPVSRGEAHSAYNSGGDEAPFTSGVPHHTPPDLAVFSTPPLSHTHSRREPGEGRRLRDGEMLIIRGRQPTRHNIYIYIYIYIYKRLKNRCLLAICLIHLHHLSIFTFFKTIFSHEFLFITLFSYKMS